MAQQQFGARRIAEGAQKGAFLRVPGMGAPFLFPLAPLGAGVAVKAADAQVAALHGDVKKFALHHNGTGLAIDFRRVGAEILSPFYLMIAQRAIDRGDFGELFHQRAGPGGVGVVFIEQIAGAENQVGLLLPDGLHQPGVVFAEAGVVQVGQMGDAQSGVHRRGDGLMGYGQHGRRTKQRDNKCQHGRAENPRRGPPEGVFHGGPFLGRRAPGQTVAVCGLQASGIWARMRSSVALTTASLSKSRSISARPARPMAARCSGVRSKKAFIFM